MGLGALIVLALLIQLIPYGHNHTNPPVVKEFNWTTPAAKEIAQRACYDCHSNETKWLWYSSIAPMSWLVARDVDEGRAVFNFSDWQGVTRHEGGRTENGTRELVEVGVVQVFASAGLAGGSKRARPTGMCRQG